MSLCVVCALNATLMSSSAFQHLPVKFRKNKDFAIMAINKDPYYEEELSGWIYSSLIGVKVGLNPAGSGDPYTHSSQKLARTSK